RRAAAEDAANNTLAGRIAVAQAGRAAAALAERQRWATVLDIERLQTEGARPRRGIDALWSALTGAGTPVSPIQQALLRRSAAEPRNPEPLVLLGDALLLAGDSAGATQHFEAAARLAPQRPEPLYGLARAALPADRARARALLERAIALDPSYFPARLQLAVLAEQERDWPTAIAQRRWLHENRPGADSTLALASTLRLSGPGGYAEAERTLLPLANQDHVGALIELAELYRANNDLRAARQALERAQKITPRGAERYADVAYEMGRLLVEENNINEAEIQFEAALSANPRHVPSLLALAQINRNDPQIATRHYRAALEAGGGDAATLKQIGTTLLAYRAYDLAATAFERAVAAAPDDPAAHYGLALANLRLGRLAAAQNEAHTAITAAGGSYPEAQVVLGDVALEQGDAAGAVQEYNTALRQDDMLAAGYIGLGRAAASQGNWSVALGHFRNAARRDERSAEARLWLGEALLRAGDARAAAEAYAEALARRPDYAEAYLGLAQAQIQLGQIASAEDSLARAVELRPAYAEAYLVRGRLFEQQGQDNRALEAYARAIDAGDRLAEPRYRRALILIRSGRLDDARGDLEAAVRIQPIFPEAQYWLGRVHFAQGRFDRAAERFRTAVAQRNTYAEARYYLGLAEERAGRPAEAVAAYRAAAEQGDGTIWADEARQALTRLGSP
ncbi:MAG TPA: tetratricopeptide repeat protein, partial [Roseiflexaceae bacterium]|nr:tetratricopeptide repeat protein [Roseiflexaceae bacterium]